MLRPYTRLDPAQLYDVAADFDAELLQQQLAHRTAGDPRHGLARAGPLQDVACVLAVVLQAAGQVGMSRPGPRDLAPPLGPGGVRLGRHHVPPVLPVAVPHQHGDGRAERLPGAHPREPLDLIRLDLHTGAAAVAAHAPFQLGVDPLGGHGQAGGDPLEDRHQAAAVRLTCRRKPERHRRSRRPRSRSLPSPESRSLSSPESRLKPRLGPAAEAALRPFTGRRRVASSLARSTPSDNNARARLRVGLSLPRTPDPQGPVGVSRSDCVFLSRRETPTGPCGSRGSHRIRGAGSGFVKAGRLTITSPRAVIPNSSWLPVETSFATRSGPMIGSRIEIVPTWKPKYVSNTSMLASNRATNSKRSFGLPLPPHAGVSGGHEPEGAKLWL